MGVHIPTPPYQLSPSSLLSSPSLAVFIALLLSLASPASSAPYSNRVVPSCPPEDEVCEFHFRVSANVTMMRWTSNSGGNPSMEPVVVGPDGYLYAQNFSCGLQRLTEAEMETFIGTDGRHKWLTVVNNQFPGPPIVVYKGQRISVTVMNELSGMGISFHWHGLDQKGTPWMDGAGGVSQCPILPGQVFQYRFEAGVPGTYWYHGHVGNDRSMGLAGSLTVLDRSMEEENARRGDDPLPAFDDQFHILLTDWFIEDMDDLLVKFKYSGLLFSNGFDDVTCFEVADHVDGAGTGYLAEESVLVNGKGAYADNDHAEARKHFPLEIFRVKKGGKFRFRMGNIAMQFPFRLSIDYHTLHVVASDGSDIRTTSAESVLIGSGERFDFWLDARDPADLGNYWIRVESYDYDHSQNRPFKETAIAILRYEGAPEELPTSEREECTVESTCLYLNCPYHYYPKSDRINCLQVTTLRMPVPKPTLQPTADLPLLQVMLAMEMGTPGHVAVINGKSFVPHDCPPQTYPKDNGMTPCDESVCQVSGCSCTHQIDLPKDHIIQLVLYSPKPRETVPTASHPMHLHGHRFQVLKMGFPKYDNTTGHVTGSSWDIHCAGWPLHCHYPHWAHPEWAEGHIPGLIEEGAIEKDTIQVPAGGYVVLRFKTDNPGYWLIHCHMLSHSSAGMKLVIKEGEDEDMPALPPDFPRCDHFHISDDYLKDVLHKPLLYTPEGKMSPQDENSGGAEEEANPIEPHPSIVSEAVPTTATSALSMSYESLLSISSVTFLQITIGFLGSAVFLLSVILMMVIKRTWNMGGNMDQGEKKPLLS